MINNFVGFNFAGLCPIPISRKSLTFRCNRDKTERTHTSLGCTAFSIKLFLTSTHMKCGVVWHGNGVPFANTACYFNREYQLSRVVPAHAGFPCDKAAVARATTTEGTRRKALQLPALSSNLPVTSVPPSLKCLSHISHSVVYVPPL